MESVIKIPAGLQMIRPSFKKMFSEKVESGRRAARTETFFPAGNLFR